MAVSGTWGRQNAFFSGAGKQGSGGYAIHGVRDIGHGREFTSDPASDLLDVPDQLVEHRDWGYGDGDYYAGEAEAGLRHVGDRPAWNTAPDRGAVPADYPQPGHRQASQEFHEVPHASQEEAMRANAVVRPSVTGGWLAKAVSYINHSQPSAPAQYEMNTSMTQGMGVREYANDRAVARGGAPRSPIQSRSVAMIAKQYAKSFEMGGGPGTPRMTPYQQTPELRRPFYYRTAGTGPIPDAPYNVADTRVPYSYQAPADPDPGQPATSSGSDGYGYTEGDFF